MGCANIIVSYPTWSHRLSGLPGHQHPYRCCPPPDRIFLIWWSLY